MLPMHAHGKNCALLGRGVVQAPQPRLTGHAKYIQRLVIALATIGNPEKFDTHSSLYLYLPRQPLSMLPARVIFTAEPRSSKLD